MSEFRVNNLSNESDSGGPTFSGITTFSSPYFFVPPVGNTQDRPDDPVIGDLRFNTDVLCLEYYKGDSIGWAQVTAVKATGPGPNSGFTGFIAGANDPSPWSPYNNIDYITITTMGNSADFGDLEVAKTGKQTIANKNRILFPGGYAGGGYQIHISYNNIQSKGNGADFGDLIQVKAGASCVANNTRGLVGQSGDQNASPYATNIIESVAIQTTGNTTDFGDATSEKGSATGMNSSTRGIWGAQDNSPAKLVYTTISTLGNTQDFGTYSQHPNSGACNSTRGIWAGSYFNNSMGYTTIATLGDVTDFGDLVVARFAPGGASSPTRGVIIGGKSIPSQYVINTMDTVQLMTLGNAVDFGDISYMSSETDYTAEAFTGSNGHGGVY